MKHILALILKFGVITLILIVVSSQFLTLTLGQILIISATVTFISYLIGDLLILPKSNNTIATFSDFILASFIIFLFNFIFRTVNFSVFDTMITSVLIVLGEWILHKYMSNKVLTK